MKKSIIVFISLFGLLEGLELNAQAFSIDTTFQPYYNIRYGQGGLHSGGHVLDLVELPSGKLFIVGTFSFNPSGEYHAGITSLLRNGNRNTDFKGMGGNIKNVLFYMNDSVIVASEDFYHIPFDSSGTLIIQNWKSNVKKTVPCPNAYVPYFYSDGSSLMANSKGNRGCNIVISNDTFPHRYIVKVDPQGNWDSSFVKDANHTPWGFVPYDSNRILVYGLPRYFTEYDGHTINGICRIYKDGTLDTTFNSPVVPTDGGFTPSFVEKDGGFFLHGWFKINGHQKYQSLVRLNADGTLDSSFMNFQGPVDSTNMNFGVGSIVPTPDGGYLIGVHFEIHQGLSRNNISKIDSNGIVDPRYFNSIGPDSSYYLGDGWASISHIAPSVLGGYYVAGDFLKWDGKPVQALVRLHGMTTSIPEHKIKDNIHIYPNPSSGTVSIPSMHKINRIQIFTVQGKFIKEIEPSIDHTSLDLNLSNGMYLLRFYLKNKTSQTSKLIISNN